MVFLIKNKSNATALVPKLFNMVATQFNLKIKCFRSDNALRNLLLLISSMNRVCYMNFLVWIGLSRVRLLSANINIFWMLLVHSIFSQEFQFNSGLIVLTAIFLINQIPFPLLGNNTPYELLYKECVDYSSFKLFCCLAFASTLLAHRTKFQPRTRVCVFLGYPPSTKGYRLYDIQSK